MQTVGRNSLIILGGIAYSLWNLSKGVLPTRGHDHEHFLRFRSKRHLPEAMQQVKLPKMQPITTPPSEPNEGA